MLDPNTNKTDIQKEKYLIEDARRSFAKGDYALVRIYCKLAIKINNNSFYTHFLNGCAMYNDGDLKSARKEFAKALKLNPDSQCTKINIGVIDSQTGHLSGMEDIEKMYPDYVNCVKIFELKGIMLAQRGEYELSDKYFEKAKYFYNSASIYTNHGTAILEKYLSQKLNVNDIYRAIEQFDYAIVNSEFDKYAYYNRCRAYILINQYKKALSDAKKLVAFDAQDPGFLYILAKTQMLCGKYDAAIDNAFYAHWYGTLFNSYVADEALKLCDEIARLKNKNSANIL